MTKPKVRSSSMPMLMSCVNAVLNPDNLVAVETENDTATFGHLVHALAQSVIETGEYDLAPLKARLTQAEYDRANVQFFNFLSALKEAQPYMPTPQAEVDFEVELSHLILTGHIDLLQLDPLRAFILDYKTGRMHEDHYHQMAAYAYGAWDKAGRPKNFVVYVTTIYLEDNTVQNYTFTVANLLDWEREVAAQVVELKYTAGRKCAHCPLQGTCPAYRVWGAGAANLFAGAVGVPSWDEMTPELRGELIDKMYVVEAAIKRVKDSLRNRVKKVGPLDISGGKEYTVIETEEKQVDMAKALPVLIKVLKKDAIYSNSTLSLDAILGEFAKKAAKGKKQAARQHLFDELDKAGAITRTKSSKMWRRPVDEKLLEESK